MSVFDFLLEYSDGSLYQGRVRAESLVEALEKVRTSLPDFPGNPEPISLNIKQKLGG